MKYLTITRLAPGTDNARRALETYGKVGTGDQFTNIWAAVDGKTFYSISDADPDMTLAMTYAPFWEEITVVPIVDLDGAWLTAAQAAQGNWST
jgi:hypothetical protein